MARRAAVRVWHQRVLEPTVFYALVAGGKVHIALAPYRFMRRPLLPHVVLVRAVLVLLLLREPLLAVVPAPVLEAVGCLRVPLLLVLLVGGHRLTPAAPEVLKVLWMVRVATVLLVLPMVWVMSWVLLFVLHAVIFKS